MPVAKIERPVKRSALHQGTQTVSSNSLPSAKLDAWGAAIIVGICVSVVFLMRMILAAAQ